MSEKQFLDLEAFQWLGLLIIILTGILLADALAGHYRSGFENRSQYTPFLSGGFLVIATVLTFILPSVVWTSTILEVAGWTAVVTGLIGFGFHHFYGVAKKPGGYNWLLHYLMYGAPPLAPIALSVIGVLGLITARGLQMEPQIFGFQLRTSLLVLTAVSLFGAILQAGILHYRGAFNNPLMYLPLTVPLAAVLAATLVVMVPGPIPLVVPAVLLWLTMLIGFVGWGMHLRGFDRQMGGLYIAVFNWLEGPPAFAPLNFSGYAAVGLVVVYLL